jgi:flagellar biosynthesis protein FlhG
MKDDLDVLIVDTPAGASDSSIEFAAACSQILVVLVGEPTSFMDAYAFIKALNIEKGVEKVSIVVNLAKDVSHANHSFNSFKKIVNQFLSVEVFMAGWLPNTPIISNSIVARKPFVLNTKADPILNKKIQEITQHVGDLETLPNKNVRFFDS